MLASSPKASLLQPVQVRPGTSRPHVDHEVADAFQTYVTVVRQYVCV